MTTPLRPQYFCARPNGTLVPLVAVDELPTHINVRGAPRVLSPGDTQGMTSLGTVAPRGQYYLVDGTTPTYSRYHQTGNSSGNGSGGGNGSGQRGRDYENQVAAPRYVPEENGMSAQRLALQPLYQSSNAQNWAMVNASAGHGWLVPANVGAGHAAVNASGNNRQTSHPKKEYCSYWIRHGECDYQQQGCLFKHEMPTDRSMLEKLGLRDIPRWYRDKYSVSSLLSGGSNQSRDSRAQGHDDTQERGVMKTMHHTARLAPNAAAEKADAEKISKNKSTAPMPLAVPGNLMLSSSASSPRGPASSRGPRQPSNAQMQSFGSIRGQVPQTQAHISSPQSRIPSTHSQTSKKLDLLSFDSAPDYTSLELKGAGQKDINRPETKERVKRDEFLRNLHGIFVGTNANTNTNTNSMTSPGDFLPAQARTKRSQPKSRRLYQPRIDMTNTKMETDEPETGSKILRPSAMLYNTAAEAIAKETGVNPLLASPGTGFIHGSVRSSESPIHGASSTQSCASSSEPSPRVYGGRIKKETETKPLLPPIGTFTHRNPTLLKRPASSADDLFDMGIGRAK